MIEVNLSKDSEYHTQRNNVLCPLSTCNTTSAIMALKSSGIKKEYGIDMQPEDALTQLLQSDEANEIMKKQYRWAIQQGYPANQVHGMLCWGINKYVGREVDVFRSSLTLQEMIWNLLHGWSMIVTGKFTQSGHMVVLAGLKSSQKKELIRNIDDVNLELVKYMIIDDPYGNYHTGYFSSKGNNIRFTLSEFHRLTKEYNNNGAKWAHIIKEIGG